MTTYKHEKEAEAEYYSEEDEDYSEEDYECAHCGVEIHPEDGVLCTECEDKLDEKN